MLVKTEAIVLNSFKYGESSKIVTLFTKDFGKIKVIAKGSRKAKNKFASSLDPLSYCQISFYHKPSTELYLLSDAEHIVPLRKIQDSYHHLSAGLIIAEAINLAQDVNETNKELFELSAKVLKFLNGLPESPFSVSTFFLIKLTEIIGFAIDFQTYPIYYPELNEGQHPELAIEKQTEIARANKSGKIFFAIETGSFILPSNEKNIFAFNPKVANEMFEIACCSISDVGGITLDKLSIQQLHDFFNIYYSYHLDRKNSFKTMNFFKTIL